MAWWLARRTVRSVSDERLLWLRHVADSDLARMPLAEVKRRHVREFVKALAQNKKQVPKPDGQRGYKLPKAAAVDADMNSKWTFLSEQEIEQLLSCQRIARQVGQVVTAAAWGVLQRS